MIAPETLHLSPERALAYHRFAADGDKPDRPGVIFLGGFKSDMTGTKAMALEAHARARGQAFVRFDYRGHGASSADFEEGCIGDWADDAIAVFQRLTTGPQIVVGSSMGGWIALLLARAMPERVAGLIGIAAAPDFTEDSMWPAFTDDQRSVLMSEGRLALPSEYSDEPYVITRRLIEDGRAHLVLRTPLDLPFPVRLLHGTADADVPVDRAMTLLGHMTCPDARAVLVKDADHRFSEPAELALLMATVDALSGVGG